MAKKVTVVKALSALKDLVDQCVADADQVRPGTAAENARQLIEVRALAELIQEHKTRLEELKSRLAYDWVPAAFEREKAKTITLQEGYRVTVSPHVSASTKSMSAGIEWMRLCACGHPKDDHDTINGRCTADVETKGKKNGKKEFHTCNTCTGYFAPNAGLVKETINAQSLAAFAKELLAKEGRDLPDHIFNVTVGNNTSITKI